MKDRDLIRLYWPVELRPAFDALFDLEETLADVVAQSTQPTLGAIRLAWWREALQRLDTAPPPPEPRLHAVAAELLPRGVSGARLAEIEEGFATLLDEYPDIQRVQAGGAALFGSAALLLGASDPRLGEAGGLHALARAMRFGNIGPAVVPEGLDKHSFRRALRPLTAFARLAARDVRRAPRMEPEATPGRAAALIAHHLFGTIA